MLRKEKKCKGTGKAAGHGCGNKKFLSRFGLCSECYPKWLFHTEEGQELIIKSSNISPYSKKRVSSLQKYNKLRIEFLSKPENKICPITKKPTTDIHHKKGRIGNLLTDMRYWVALSREGHIYVENNPIWAKENGYSLNRTSND